ncbi:competence protein ComGC [Mycetocola sp. CAN_C7]
MSQAFNIFPIIFIGVLVLIALVIVFIIVSAARNAKKVKDAGHDPFTLQTDLATRAMDSELLRPAAASRTTEERLRELETLRAAGSITAEEHAAARADILRGI